MIYKSKLTETVKYEVAATNISPVSVKDGEDNIKIDELTGKAYIPGTSIAGAFRDFYEKNIDRNSDENNNVLFGGKKTGMSSVVFYDAYFTDATQKEVISSRPGLKIDRERLTGKIFSGSKKSGSKFKRQFLNEGINFIFTFELNNYEASPEFDKMQKDFEELLKAFLHGEIPLGNNKMIGFGRFKGEKVLKKVVNFESMEGILSYLLKEDGKTTDITEKIMGEEYISPKVQFKVKAKTLTPLLIKDEVVRLSDKPDGINIKNAKGNEIIPGSSIKGALRTRAEKISKTFPQINEEIISNIFGIESKKDEGRISRFNCFDVELKHVKRGVYNKIKVDHFSGGVEQGALVKEETVMGDLELICTLDKSELGDYTKEVGLILLVLRDLCIGNLNVGSGYAVGRGFVKAETLEIIDNEKLLYYFDSPDKEVEQKFNRYISELMKQG
ncbi:MAG TPA: hypothetical protein DCE02_01095 [Ruminiclostridium sp.]|jgi:CRISPR/Cas system CSM-associated protein Csm3 (group 7 of RAMP superfamily)|uniref:RAMP superfamily CRISPR-associated protein n=1 Tax=Acetivibrio saccincola TaxID=1677857 RepID=UPI000EDF719C|nr:RAMP superfamily CRISPR-associated protein [Acetivibrio saccincola]NLW26732.1 hypothetical protein [Acetivibrio saccincola]HAA42591.1 hypothetical protein [Ruminiclostridium sp.]